MMKGSMALDMIVKFIIILVVAGIVIGLFIVFSQDAGDALKCFLFGCDGLTFADEYPKPINKFSFSSGEIAQYIESCYDTMSEVPEVNQSDIVCYILMADSQISSSANEEAIRESVPADIKTKIVFNTNLSKDYVRVEFRELEDKIVVS